MNVWLDDKRPMPPGFDVWTTNAYHAVKFLKCGLVDMISLDHDLAEKTTVGDGYVVAKAIEEMVCTGHLKRKLTVLLHSMNPVGVTNMKMAILAAVHEGDIVTLLEVQR